MKKLVTSLKEMKKSLLITLCVVFTISLVFMILGITLAATGEWETPPKEHTLALNGEGYNVMRLVGTGNKIKRGTDLHFQILLQDNFLGTPVVKVNNSVITPNENDVYSIWNVKSNKTINVSGLLYMPRLGTPSNLEINGTMLSWADVDNATSYTVSIMWTGVDDISGGFIEMEATHIVNETHYDLSALSDTKRYVIMVKANTIQAKHQESDWSDTIHLNCTC